MGYPKAAKSLKYGAGEGNRTLTFSFRIYRVRSRASFRLHNAGSLGLDRKRARRADLSSKSTATDFPSSGPASLGVNLNGQTLTGARCGRARPGTACARCLSPFFQANIME